MYLIINLIISFSHPTFAFPFKPEWRADYGGYILESKTSFPFSHPYVCVNIYISIHIQPEYQIRYVTPQLDICTHPFSYIYVVEKQYMHAKLHILITIISSCWIKFKYCVHTQMYIYILCSRSMWKQYVHNYIIRAVRSWVSHDLNRNRIMKS